MSIEQEIADLTQSTTDLLNAVNTKKATLDTAVDTAEAAKAVATSKAAEATTVVANASTHETNAANSAAQAAASAASASQIVTGVATGLPNIRPSLNLDFVNSKTVDPRIDFTRSTTATYYDGKTTVKAEENFILYSKGYTASISNGGTVTNNATVSPDGTTTAILFDATANTSLETRRFAVAPIATQVANKTYAISYYFKNINATFVQTFVGGSENDWHHIFDASTMTMTNVGNATDSYNYRDVGNGWYRIEIIFTPDESFSSPSIYLVDTGTSSRASQSTQQGSYYIWGFQVEERDTVTALTETTGSPITNYVPVLQTAAINEPRLDHDPVTGECKGLLMEESRTNHCAYSEDISIGAQYNTAVTVATHLAIAPNGTLTADKVIPTGNGARRGDHFTLIGQMVEGDTYTLSGFYKADGSHYTRVRLGGVFGNEAATFDFETGEFVEEFANVVNTKAEDVGNGWWRLSVTYVFQNQIGNNYPYALIAQPKLSNGSTSAPSYTGYNGVYVWGVQYEKASFASSYIPTNGAAVTRSMDSAVVSGAALQEAFNNSEFSFYAEMQRTGSASTHQEFAGIELSSDIFQKNALSLAYDSGSFNRANVRLFNTSGTMTVLLGSSGGVPNFEDGEEITKFAFGLKQGDSRLYAQGLSNPSATTSLSTTPFTPDYLRIQPDNIRDTFSNFSGYCRKVSLYPQRLLDTELQALTQE